LTFLDYEKGFWCGFCGMKIKRGDENHDKNGRTCCWKCGRPLRDRKRGT